MRDVVVIEAAQHVQDSIRLTDVGQELIPQPFALARALHQTSDVDDLDGRGDDALGLDDLGQLRQALIGDGDDPDVGLDGAEGEVSGLRLRVGEAVEEGGLTDVGQAYDTTL